MWRLPVPNQKAPLQAYPANRQQQKGDGMATIVLDMDGTIADLYGYPHWLGYLANEDAGPYRMAEPLVNVGELEAAIDFAHSEGIRVAVVSYGSKGGTDAYDGKVKCAKLDWLERHGLIFDEVHVTKHGTPKASVISDNLACLIDDEQGNRDTWSKGRAYDASDVVGSFFAAIDWLRATRL